MLNFILAGRDTTAQTIMWGMYLLSINEDICEKLYNEVKDVNIEYDELKDLKYTENFINEVLRLYPPVPTDGKSAIDHDVLPNGVRVHPAQTVAWLQNEMGRMKRYFPEPLKVIPERWEDWEKYNGGVECHLNKGAMIPFQYGPRICLGKQLAMYESKAVLALIVKKFKFELAPNQDVVRHPNITICAKNGIKFKVKSRK